MGNACTGSKQQNKARAAKVIKDIPNIDNKEIIVDIEDDSDTKSSPELMFETYVEEFKEKASTIVEVIDGDHNITQFFDDLNISIENADSFIVSYIFNVSAFGRVTKDEFVATCQRLKVNSKGDLKRQVHYEMIKIKKSDNKLMKFYEFIWSMATANKASKQLEFALAQKLFSVLIGDCDVFENS